MKFLLASLLSVSVILTPGSIVLDNLGTMGAHCLMPRPQVMAQEGNPGHREPPPGWTCSQEQNTPADHKCSCHRECKDAQNTDENGQATEGQHTEVREDAKCRSFCYKDHCMCPVHNCE